LTNFGWILDGKLAGSGIVFPEEGALLIEHGVRAILSLTERNPAANDPFPTGITHLHLPIPDFSPPAPETRERAMEFIDGNLSEDRPVLVHCGAGYGRTGTILACFLVHCGVHPEEAIDLVRMSRPGSIETSAQEEAVRIHAREMPPKDAEETEES